MNVTALKARMMSHVCVTIPNNGAEEFMRLVQEKRNPQPEFQRWQHQLARDMMYGPNERVIWLTSNNVPMIAQAMKDMTRYPKHQLSILSVPFLADPQMVLTMYQGQRVIHIDAQDAGQSNKVHHRRIENMIRVIQEANYNPNATRVIGFGYEFRMVRCRIVVTSKFVVKSPRNTVLEYNVNPTPLVAYRIKQC